MDAEAPRRSTTALPVSEGETPDEPRGEAVELVHLARNQALFVAPFFLWTLTLAWTGAAAAAFAREPAAVVGAAGAIAFLSMVASSFASVWSWNRNPRPTRRTTTVRASARGLWLGDRWIPREHLREGFVVRRGDDLRTFHLALRSARSRVELAVRDADEARKVLTALGLEASQTVARVPEVLSKAAGNLRFFVASTGAIVALVGAILVTGLTRGHGALLSAVMILAVLSFLAWFALLAVPTRVDVGVDGIVLSWLGSRRFIGFERVASVAAFHEPMTKGIRGIGVALELTDGETLKIPVGTPGLDQEHVDMLLGRIEDAMDHFRRGGGAGVEASAFKRGDEPLRGWIERLRSIGHGANADHRQAPVAVERLVEMVRDPRARPIDRAAAAVAAAAGSEEARAGLRALAEAVAAPRLRFAISVAADRDRDAELEAALAELEQAERAAPARTAVD